MSSERADIHSVPALSDCALFRFPAPEFPDRNTGMSAEKTAQVILIQQPHERTGLFQGQPAHPHQLTDPFHFQPVEIAIRLCPVCRLKTVLKYPVLTFRDAAISSARTGRSQVSAR